MLRSVLLFSTLTACTTETWVLAPDVEESIEVSADSPTLQGTVLLTYDEDAMPLEEHVVSNSLRLSATSATGGTLVVDYPGAPEGLIVTPSDASSRNLNGAYRPCGEGTCRVEIPFEVLRAADESDVITVTGDAILTREAFVRDHGSSLVDRASLTIVWSDLD